MTGEPDTAEPQPGSERVTTGEKGETIVAAACHHCEEPIYMLNTTGPYAGDLIPPTEREWLHHTTDREECT